MYVYPILAVMCMCRISSNSSRPSNRPRRLLGAREIQCALELSAQYYFKAYVITQSEQDQAKCCLVGHILHNHRELLRHEDFRKCRRVAGKPGTVV